MHTHSTTSTQDLLDRIAAQEAVIAELSTCHLGILSNGGIRHALARLNGPVDLIAVDWRKLHEWNDILGRNIADLFFAQFAQTRQGRERRQGTRPRRLDVRGQWGGDELIFAVAPGDGIGLLRRLLRALDDLTAQLSDTQRQAIADQTGGLIDGFCIVAVLIAGSTDVYHRDPNCRDSGDVARAIAECGRLKQGCVTGARATSGHAGTIIGTLLAGGK